MRKACFAVSCCLLAGCSNFAERHQASGDFEYLDAKQGSQLEVPADLTPIERGSVFDIPSLKTGNTAVNMGADLDIRAPLLPMAVAKDSRVIDKGKVAQIQFESLKSADELKEDIWQRLTSFLNDNQYGISDDESFVSMETDWLVSQPAFMMLYGLDEDVNLKQKYRFDLEVGEHGHSANLRVKLAAHEQSNSDEILNNSASRRYETQMLNMLLSHLHKNERRNTLVEAKKARRGMQMELGFDAKGDSAYVIQAPFEQAWSKMSRVLPQLGFTVEDRDKTLGMYFVRFEGVDAGFWSSLWSGDDVPEIALDKGKYQIHVQSKGEMATVGVIDEAGDKLDADKLTQMYNAFKAVVAKNLL